MKIQILMFNDHFSGLSTSSTPQALESYPTFEATLSKLNMSEAKLYLVKATKPNHEVGASRLLSFAKPKQTVPEKPAASVWTLEDIDDDTVELMDDNTLLAEEDLVKPDPSSLRFCCNKC